EDSIDPPFEETYRNLLTSAAGDVHFAVAAAAAEDEEDSDMPLIDMSRLNLGDAEEGRRCREEICRASKEWGFFQVVNHGISRDVLEKMREEQIQLLRKPFREKIHGGDFKFSAGSYRWGTPSATCLRQLSWSEAFHVCLNDVLNNNIRTNEMFSNFRLGTAVEKFSIKVSELSQKLVDILSEEIGEKSCFFKETCLPTSCYLRMNRYPPCPVPHKVFGIMPHTDSAFITVLHQDHVGGLHLVKDGKWIAVKPNPDALIINIGDLFQAWSNNVYKSVQHCVVANPVVERFSTAYFLCPSYDTVIRSNEERDCVYRSFSFGEYREKVQEDVKIFGHKVGLPRFLIRSN
ncbi:gibberellin 2-oxidase 1, partial [Genlisea aurea]